jgi:hypothetical protein
VFCAAKSMRTDNKKNGAHIRTRTGDLFLTKEVLYLLSYVGELYWSGKRDSNPRPSAWKADALAN